MVQEIKVGWVQAIVVTDIGRLVCGCSLFLDFVEQVLLPYGVARHSVSCGLYTPQKDDYISCLRPGKGAEIMAIVEAARDFMEK